MKATLQSLLPALSNNELFVDSPEKLQPFHIYFKLKDFGKETIAPADSTRMYIHHLKHEKCLSLLRQRNLEGAHGMIAELSRLDRQFPASVQYGMDSLHYALLAYVDYILFNNPDAALSKLKVAITRAEQQSVVYPYFSLSIPTQWINVLRLVIRFKSESDISEEATNLFKLCLFGISENNELQRAYQTLGYQEHVLVIGDVFDNIHHNLDKFFGLSYSVRLINQIVRDVLAEVGDAPGLVPSILYVLKLLQLADKNQVDELTQTLVSNQNLLIDIPDSLKRILVHVIGEILQTGSCEPARLVVENS